MGWPLRVEPKVTFNKHLGYSKNSSGRSEPNSLIFGRTQISIKSYFRLFPWRRSLVADQARRQNNPNNDINLFWKFYGIQSVQFDMKVISNASKPWSKNFEKMTFFDQNGVKKFFFYFSLNTLPKTFKIIQAKKIFDQKNFLAKSIVRPLHIYDLELFQVINVLIHFHHLYHMVHMIRVSINSVTYFS